ncbi:MAG: leucine--tRNA ligase [Malacoplasma sp.]
MYNFKLIEQKWKKYWDINQTYKFDDNNKNNKYYVLDMFPYPSGSGLHVGHPKGYIATDILARYKKMNGFSVLHPIGWDAFGLPAEQYAINTNNHPKTFTQENITNFRKQLQNLGFSYDYNKEVNTTDPEFYKWTQWIFIKLYEHNLAEIKTIEVNWCEELKTVLANEEVLTDKDGNKVSERGSFPVIKKPMKQWVLKITNYAEKLLEGLHDVNWNDGLKNIQSTWIGKSIGMNIDFQVENSKDKIKIFTSKPNTIFGVSFIGVNYNHDLVKKTLLEKEDKKLSEIIDNLKQLKEFERTKSLENPIGYFLNKYVICPFTNKKIPIYLCEYVMDSYANGAIMGVPFCDKRDYHFATKHKISIIKILDVDADFYDGDGTHINSSFLNGLDTCEANKEITKELISKKIGEKIINYKLRDWIFSRQRYWGEPFPILFDENNNIIIEKNLPLLLPNTDNFKMSEDGKPPLANLEKWVNVKIDNKNYTRETNTMPQWAGSCWYYLAYILKQDDGSYIPLNSKEAYALFERWLPVDMYIGGQEHAVLHLLYSRFWHRFLYDIKVIPSPEPFIKIINQGMVLGENNEKMSKSKGNVISPDDIIEKYGADSLRVYEMFMGPISASLSWKTEGLSGICKWLDRIYRLFNTIKIVDDDKNIKLDSAYNLFLFKVSNMIENLEYNLAISEMMIFINECYKCTIISKNKLMGFLQVLSCFAPFISEDLWENNFDQKKSIYFSQWPKTNKNKIIESTIKLAIQINGKFIDVLELENEKSEKEIFDLIKVLPKMISRLENKEIDKTIYVKNKIFNILLKK